MNFKEKCKGISFNWHHIHNEFVVFIMNIYCNGFMNKKENLRSISQLMLVVLKVLNKPTQVFITYKMFNYGT
jgi:hypothetical protein